MKTKRESDDKDLSWLTAMETRDLTIKDISHRLKYYNIPRLSKYLKDNQIKYLKKRDKK